jgi:outer membrane protein TolC
MTMTRFKLVILIALISPIFALSTPSSAQERLELSLSEAVGISLRENLSLAEEDVLFRIAEAEIKVSEGEFDPALTFEVNQSFEKAQSATSFTSAEEKLTRYGISFGGKVNTGTSYELALSSSRTEVSQTPFLLLNPYYRTALELTLTQPLLKGFGRGVQESSLMVARKNQEIAGLRTEHRIMEIIADTVGAYWELYFARGDREVSEFSLELAENTLKEVRAKIEAGSLAPVEIYSAEAEVAIREENLLRAGKAVSDAEDALKAVMNFKDWDKEVVPVETPPEPAGAPELEALLAAALENRRDFKQSLEEQKNKEILRKFQKNQKLPEMNLIAGAGLNGLDGNFGNSLDSTASGDFYSWQVGLSLSLPINNRTAAGNYLKAKYDEEMARLDTEVLRQNITVEVREALRALTLARESVKATGKTRVASEKRLNAEQERFRLGMAILNDVLRFQEEYATALSSEKRALVDYAKAAVNLRKATGALLENQVAARR